jgi:hypothetical protein
VVVSFFFTPKFSCLPTFLKLILKWSRWRVLDVQLIDNLTLFLFLRRSCFIPYPRRMLVKSRAGALVRFVCCQGYKRKNIIIITPLWSGTYTTSPPTQGGKTSGHIFNILQSAIFICVADYQEPEPLDLSYMYFVRTFSHNL